VQYVGYPKMAGLVTDTMGVIAKTKEEMANK